MKWRESAETWTGILKKRRLMFRSDLPSPAEAGFAKAGALLRRVVRGDAGTGWGDAGTR